MVEFKAALVENGVVEIWRTVNDGGFLIRCYPDGGVALFEIPLYGGEERYAGVYEILTDAVREGLSWT